MDKGKKDKKKTTAALKAGSVSMKMRNIVYLNNVFCYSVNFGPNSTVRYYFCKSAYHHVAVPFFKELLPLFTQNITSNSL